MEYHTMTELVSAALMPMAEGAMALLETVALVSLVLTVVLWLIALVGVFRIVSRGSGSAPAPATHPNQPEI